MAEPRSRAIAWAGLANVVGGATGSLVGLLLAALVGRSLGVEGAGRYFLVVAVFAVVSNIAELGADTGLVRFVSAARATGRAHEVPTLVAIAVRPVLLVGVVLVALAGLGPLLAPEAVGGLSPGFVAVAAVACVCASLLAVALAVTRGLGAVLVYPLLQNVALPVLRLVAIAAVVIAGGGVTAVLVAWMLPVPFVLVAATGAAWVMTARGVEPAGGQAIPAGRSRRLRRDFWSFSAARGLSAAVEIALEWIDVILVGLLTSTEAAGVYAVVTRCARAGEVVQQAARIAVGPQVSAALARGALDEARRLYGLVTAAMIWLAWPFFLLLAVFADAVLSLFGPGFSSGAVSLAVLSLAMAIATAAGSVQTILLMGGRSRWQLIDKSIALAVNVALNLLLVPWWGIEGAATAWAVTIVADTVLVTYQVQHLMGLRPQVGGILTAAALSVGVVGVTAVGARLVLGSSVGVLLGTTVVAALVYLAASAALRHRLGLVELVDHRAQH